LLIRSSQASILFSGEMDGDAGPAAFRVPNAKDGGDRPSGDVDDNDEADTRPGIPAVRYCKFSDARFLESEEESR
jgi:hypothetical protein